VWYVHSFIVIIVFLDASINVYQVTRRHNVKSDVTYYEEHGCLRLLGGKEEINMEGESTGQSQP
jgi:hypothetical protein